MNFEDILKTKQELISFERKIACYYEAGKIRAPIHLSYGNEDPLIEVFRDIGKNDWVFTTYRNHYHALLKGIPEGWLEKEILEGRSMGIINREHRFFSSAIVGGHLPIALGVALSLKLRKLPEKVWAFCGDMAAETGEFHLCTKYAARNDLPIEFVVEDNGMSVDTPTIEAWGKGEGKPKVRRYQYDRNPDGKGYPHHGSGKWVAF